MAAHHLQHQVHVPLERLAGQGEDAFKRFYRGGAQPPAVQARAQLDRERMDGAALRERGDHAAGPARVNGAEQTRRPAPRAQAQTDRVRVGLDEAGDAVVQEVLPDLPRDGGKHQTVEGWGNDSLHPMVTLTPAVPPGKAGAASSCRRG